MARLPDATALGGLSAPLSGRPLATIDEGPRMRAAAALSAGFQNLGAGIRQFGNAMTAAANKEKADASELEAAQAKSRWATLNVEQHDAISRDTGWEDLPKRTDENLTAQGTEILNGVSDPTLRQKLAYSFADDKARTIAAANHRSFQLNTSAQLGFLQQQKDLTVSKGAALDDEAERVKLIDTHQALIESYAKKGYLTPLAVEKERKDFANDFATAYADAQAAKGNIGAVLSDLERARLNAANAPEPQKPATGSVGPQSSLGDLSGKYESRGDWAKAGPDNIGWAFGKYQFNSRGSLKDFMRDHPDIAEKFSGLNPESSAFASRWKQVAAEMGPAFQEAQQQSFLKHAQPSIDKATSLGFKTDDRGVMESVLSGSIQHGKWQSVLTKAAAAPGFSDLSAEDQIKKLYQARASYVANLGTLDEGTRAGVLKRYQGEIQDALKLAGQPAQDVGQPVKVASADTNFLPGKDGAPQPAPEGNVQVAQNGDALPEKRTVFDAMDPNAREKLIQRMYHMRDAQLIDEQRRLALEEKARKAESDQAEDEYRQDLYSDNPRTSVQQIVSDKRVTREAQDRLIGIFNRANKPDPISQVSRETSMSIIDKMRRPDGDPDKITNVQPIYDAYIKGDLNRADFEFLQKQFNEAKTPEGESLKDRKKLFIEGVKQSIDKSNPLMGQLDPTGRLQMYQFEVDLDRRIQEYRAQGKNPYDLLDPGKPDFMGRPEALAPYQKTLQQSIQDRTNTMVNPLPGTGSKVQMPAVPAPRQPGESIEDYLKRTGRQ